MKLTIVIFSAILILTSCHQTVKTKSETRIISVSEQTSWNVEMPENWKVLSKDQIDKIDKDGKDMIEKSTGEELKLGHRNVLAIKKNDFNQLFANCNLLRDSDVLRYDEIQKSKINMVLEAYDAEGIKYDYQIGQDTIDSYIFLTMKIKLYAPQSDEILVNQMIWDRLFENQSLLITMNYNNDYDKETLLRVIKNSKFNVKN